MKDNDHILSLHETEELCRLYFECELSLVEEKELQYILDMMPYSSPVIEQARESMIAEGLLSMNTKIRKRSKHQWFGWAAGIAASITLVLAVSLFTVNQGGGGAQGTGSYSTAELESSANEIVIAYEGGKRLGPEASAKSVDKAIEQADKLMALAEAKEREEEMKQEYIINLTSDEK